MDEWLRLFRSHNPTVRIRAAQGWLRHGESAPLAVLFEILDELHDQGLGAQTERVLRTRRDAELVPEMIRRVRSPAPFIREVACGVLGGSGDTAATPHLLAALDDQALVVRRAAGFGLANLRDPTSGPALLRHYQERNEETNVRMALECALEALGVDFQRRPW
jgi:HEAT repeat protein